jgi:phosphonate transport system substrate-binding protein
MKKRLLLLGRLGVLLIITVSMSIACQARLHENLPDNPPLSSEEIPSANQVITIGDIDPDSPKKKIERFTPLADYLANHLQEFGITEGRVVIARDVEEMAKLLENGDVDVYMDSPFPSLKIQEMVGTRIIGRRWKGGDPAYWSVYVALQSSGIKSAKDLVGKRVAFEKPHSTSGFVLPASTLIQQGITLTEISGPEAHVEPDEIGYYFSKDKENSFSAVLRGRAAGAGVSNQDYRELPEELKRRIIAFDKTNPVPRQVVSVRPGLDPVLVDKISELLMGLDEKEDGRQLLVSLKKTTKFDQLPPEALASLDNFREMIGLVSD